MDMAQEIPNSPSTGLQALANIEAQIFEVERTAHDQLKKRTSFLSSVVDMVTGNKLPNMISDLAENVECLEKWSAQSSQVFHDRDGQPFETWRVETTLEKVVTLLTYLESIKTHDYRCCHL